MSRSELAVQGLSIVAALIMVALGAYAMISAFLHFSLPDSLTIIPKTIWLTIFGALLGIAEARQLSATQPFLLHLQFLMSYFGRGLFAL